MWDSLWRRARLARALAGLVAAGAQAACVSTSPRPEMLSGPRASELMPLAVGNRWTYEVAFLGARQSLTVSIVSGEGRQFADSRNQRFTLEPDGVRDEHRYLLKDPIAVGRTWSSIIDVSTTEHYKVDEIGLRIDVPAGHFEDCVQIEARNPQGPNLSLLADQVYCPGIGLVRVVTFQERSGVRTPPQFTQDLASYKVAR
jgi:hypothetical protein